MLEQVAACTPALAGFVAKRYGERLAAVFIQMDSGERTKLEFSREVEQGDAMGPALFCLPLQSVITRIREVRVAGGRSRCIPRRRYYRGRRDITRDGGSGALPQARVDSEGNTPQPE